MVTLSAVMAVYNGDEPEAISAAIDSIINQSLPPDEFIIVIDGPVRKEIEACLAAYDHLPLIDFAFLQQNVGRGPARNHGIGKARGKYIAIMDADDVSRPNRFERQIEVITSQNLDIVGGLIEEFDRVPADLGEIRIVPLTAAEIHSKVRFRSVFNHVTLMYRRSFWESISGYRDLNYVEDWDFYLVAVHAGARVGNMHEVLVDVRRAPWRRKGYSYFREECDVLTAALRRGQLSRPVYVLSLMIRVTKLVVPAFLFAIIYKIFLRQR